MSVSTKARLVSAAHDLACEGAEVSVEAAAQAAGVSRATAYRTFAGLQQLLDALLEARGQFHNQAVQERLAGLTNALDKLEAVVAYTVEIYQTDPTLRDLTPHTGLARNPIARPSALAAVRPLITEGQREGTIRNDLNVGVITDWLLDAYVGGIEYRNMSDAEAREMFRTFYVPALRPQLTHRKDQQVHASVARHLQAALDLISTRK